MKEKYKMIAACGIICNLCDMRHAPNDPELAKEIADWFKKELNKEVKPEDIKCSWCKGDRGEHWSPDCWILQCCVDKKGLEFCYECDEFPCEKLIEWSKENEWYTKALMRLKKMKKDEKDNT
jgi:hypothetical protein